MKKIKTTKTVLLAIALLLIAGAVVGNTLAFLTAGSDEVDNTFTPSTVTTEVVETFKDGEKSNVQIVNTGDTDAYIRAAIVVTWQDAHGNVYGQKPTESSYTLTLNTSVQTDPAGQWIEGKDGFYYWSKPVAAKAMTGILISEARQLKTLTVGETTYYLNVEIIASGIQKGPIEAVKAWSNDVVTAIDEDTEALTVTPKTVVEGGAQ